MRARIEDSCGIRRHLRVRVPLMALLLVLTAGALVLGCGGSDVTPPGGAGVGEGGPEAGLNGAGATFPEPLYVEWIGEFMQIEPGISINYQGIGSGGGIQQFTQQTVDFGATDAPMTDEEIAQAEEATGTQVLHIPTVLGAVAVAFNVEGVDRLKLDQNAVSGIFLGEITRWNDPALTELNRDVSLPDEEIKVVHRSDSSGTTAIFTGYLSAISDEWEETIGTGKQVNWPTGIGGQGNDGVAAVVQQEEGALGYVELSYALETGLSTATLKNVSGSFISPSLETTTSAGQGIEVPSDLRFSLVNSSAQEAYPIVGPTWILAYSEMQGAAEADALKAFVHWALTEGDGTARALNYAPLPDELEQKALDQVERISVK